MFNFRKMFNPVQARQRRYDTICRLVGLKPDHQVLDVGCGKGESFEAFNKVNHITGLDIDSEPRVVQDNLSYIQGDGANMDIFSDQQFDVAVCVGVLEHIFPKDKLAAMAREIQRVSKSYAVVVPHQYTLVEPHYQLPLWQFYPSRLKSFLVKHFTITWYEKDPTGNYTRLNYFSRQEWGSLFPGARVLSYNHIGPLIRNFIIYK